MGILRLHFWTMFDEPEERPDETARDPAARAREKSDEFRMHAELAAVFEGPRKFDAALRADLDGEYYPTKVKVTDTELATVDLHPHHFHGEWNYTIKHQTTEM